MYAIYRWLSSNVFNNALRIPTKTGTISYRQYGIYVHKYIARRLYSFHTVLYKCFNDFMSINETQEKINSN